MHACSHACTRVIMYLYAIFTHVRMYMCLFIHSGYLYRASSSPLLLRGVPDTARILCRSFMQKRHRQLRVKDLPKVQYVAARAGFEPTTIRSNESTNELPRCIHVQCTCKDVFMQAYV